MPYRVLTPNSHGDETMQIAHDLLPDGLELVTAPHGRPEFWNLLKDADFYIGAGQFKHGPEFYSQAPKLKLVQTLSAGYNTYDLDAARAAGVPICNNGGANATAVAEHAMHADARRLAQADLGARGRRLRALARQRLQSAKLYELEDKTLGIVGLGNIGKKVARRAKAFDMRVNYYDINRMTTDQEDALGVRFVLLPELLKTSDIVSLHVPLDLSTHNLIGEREFGDDEADRDPDQHLPRPGGRGEGALQGAARREDPRRRYRRHASRSRRNPTTSCSRCKTRSSARTRPARPGTTTRSAGATPSTIASASPAASGRSGSCRNCAARLNPRGSSTIWSAAARNSSASDEGPTEGPAITDRQNVVAGSGGSVRWLGALRYKRASGPMIARCANQVRNAIVVAESGLFNLELSRFLAKRCAPVRLSEWLN